MNRRSAGSADAVLAFDLMVGSDTAHLRLLGRDRTTVVASTSRTPTGDMVYDPAVRYPDEAPMLDRLSGSARATPFATVLPVLRSAITRQNR